MKTIIHSTDFALTEALETFIRQQADKSLRVCSDQTERLIVRLKDLNDPKQDKECSVELKLSKHSDPIVVSKRGDNAYSSIRAALTRAARTALRRSGKRQARKYITPYDSELTDLRAPI